MSVVSVADDVPKDKDPQSILNEFWDGLITKKPGKVTQIFPSNLYANLLAPQHTPGATHGKNASESYQAAADECRARVKRIVRECQRTNEKFTDPDFDIEGDMGRYNCLKGLLSTYYDNDSSSAGLTSRQLQNSLDSLGTLARNNIVAPMVTVDIGTVTTALNNFGSQETPGPEEVHRIEWIFEKPAFVIDGYSSSDIRQGGNGDCWFIAAVGTLTSDSRLMERVCVERDEECGVYGFVFHRDGEWFPVVVDDNLYLHTQDFETFRGDVYDHNGEIEAKHKKNNQTGSDALYFAKCVDQNETWLPLLEKAFAKAHGDYNAIAGGITGQAVEDLTGGVTTAVIPNRILSTERLWKELLQVNDKFLFSASSPNIGDDQEARKGIALGHAYSILEAVDAEGEDGKNYRLVKIRNPWGRRNQRGIGEWNGPWSDGSREWTPYWMNKLKHTFGDDGIFWMSYEDLRKRFQLLDRTRLFDKEWTVVQNWCSVSVSWVTGYLTTKFLVEIKQEGPTVFVLSQLDDRYFRGLEGKYEFDLHFLLQEENAAAGEHIVRARGSWFGNRSVSAEVDLAPGRYEVIPKIVAEKDDSIPDVLKVVKVLADKNPQKLRQIGMNYDIAHAKGIEQLTEEEKKAKEKKEKEKAEKKQKQKEEEEKEKAEFEEWKREKAEKAKQKADQEKTKKEDAEKETSDKQKVEVEKTEMKEDKKVDENEDKEKRTEDEKEKPEAEQGESKDEATQTTEDPQQEESKGSDSNEREKQKEDEDDQGGNTPDTSDSNEPKDAPKDQSKDEPRERLVPRPPHQPSAGVPFSPAYSDAPPFFLDGLPPPPPPFGPRYGDPDAAPQPAANAPKEEDKQNPWNAVCVIGLRVYAKDPEVSIKLIKPKDPEEGAILDVDGATAAGATM